MNKVHPPARTDLDEVKLLKKVFVNLSRCRRQE